MRKGIQKQKNIEWPISNVEVEYREMRNEK
jgi:hypothetical protein